MYIRKRREGFREWNFGLTEYTYLAKLQAQRKILKTLLVRCPKSQQKTAQILSVPIISALAVHSKHHFFPLKIMTILLAPRTEHHLSSFNCGFQNIFRAKTCMRSLSCLLFLLRWNNIARKMSEKPHSIRLLR